MKKLSDSEKEWQAQANRIFYLAVPPGMVEPIARNITQARLSLDRQRSRLVVEKPFGHDLASARRLNHSLNEMFDESQIFRIDHYLGKETVQNILAFRFGNTLFEPIWNRRYIDHVQITVSGFRVHAKYIHTILWPAAARSCFPERGALSPWSRQAFWGCE
jgi:glucose-6-phosphate 1-dehydrogenase